MPSTQPEPSPLPNPAQTFVIPGNNSSPNGGNQGQGQKDASGNSNGNGNGKTQRLIVVSNRLPVTIDKDKNGEYHFKMSSGGLVSALSGCKRTMSFTWIGWPGKEIPEEDKEHVNKRLLEEFDCYPVYLADELADRHYNGFSNSILWPLFHYHPGEMNFDAANWLAYREANMRFADVVAGFCQAGDMVWVQDYHLMLLPMLLRSIIGGESNQGEMVRRELGRVKEGVDDGIVKDMLKSEPGVVEGAHDDDKEEVLGNVAEEESTPPNTSSATLGQDLSPKSKSKAQVEQGSTASSPGVEEMLEMKTHSNTTANAGATAGAGAVSNAPSAKKRPGMGGRGKSQFEKQEAAAKERGKEGVRIGFFLHTPFPSSEIYRREILLGVLQCDLIGFHTYDYARHFLSACTRILGLETMPNGIEFEGRYAQVGTFPIGIDPTQFTEMIREPKVVDRVRALKERFKGCKVMIGVDRLDYIKGVPQKLQSLEIFLTQHPEWVGKVVLVQLAIPSRQDVEEYQNLRACVNELVGRINGRFGTVEHMPIHYLHKSVPVDELTAMYALADACLVTSTRDGMNLVSYEYISSQVDGHGVMILSEFAGAAQSLNGSLIVNPWDLQSTADAIHTALTMTEEQKETAWQKLFAYVSKYTAEAWGVSFVNELTRLSGHPPVGPMIPGRKKSGSLSRTSSRASMMRRSSGRNGSFHSVREGSISGVIP